MRVFELADHCRPAFARHETFHPRFGWLRKAYEAAERSPDAFTEPDATVQLGVGKNMVHAIRYWGLAFKVLQRHEDPKRPRRPGVASTDLARTLFSEGGWDPYLEHAATLWLLHWQLLRPTCMAPAWWAVFNLYPGVQFDDEALTELVVEAAAAVDGWPSIVGASIEKDVNCLIRTYAQRPESRSSLDDILDSPFREIGLIEAAALDAKAYRFVPGPKPGLADEVVMYAALDYMSLATPGAGSISLARLASDVGGPGRAFKLSESDIYAALEAAASGHAGLRLAEPAGLKQLLVDGTTTSAARRVLGAYYRERTGSAAAWGPDPEVRCRELEEELRDLETEGEGDVMRKLRGAERAAAVRVELAALTGGL